MKSVGEIAPVTKGLKGWMFDADAPKKRLKVVLSVNGEPVETSRTWRYRKQLHREGTHPNGKCGFQFRFDRDRLTNGDVVDMYEKKTGSRVAGVPFTYISTPVFFMHIPKTAGSALNAYMSEKVGPQNALVPINRDNLRNGLARQVPQKKYVAGHMRLNHVMAEADISSFIKITLFRDPFRHLISNLAWNRRLAEPSESARLSYLSPRQQALVQFLKNTDFTDLKKMARFADDLHRAGFSRDFDNFQTRMLFPKGGIERVTSNHLNTAVDTLSLFDIVGINEQFESFLMTLCDRLSLKYVPSELERVNVHKNRFGLDPENPELRRVLNPLFVVDEALYGRVKERIG